MRWPLLVNTRLAITLLKLTTTTRLHYMGHLFGGSKATTREAILEVYVTLQDVLGHTILQMHLPHPREVVAGFYTLGFPQCIEALDGIHIPVTCPPQSDYLYYSHQGFHSIMLQAVINHYSAFISVSTGWMGSPHDAHVFHNSTLPALVESGCFKPKDTWLILTLLKLVFPASLQYISHQFGMGKATAREAVLEVCGTL
ncbi:hypothetical protein Y1Q_0022705 [Alligator mississippiensis]|uniref:DDE Tnp4 domain-containing protein n=1 Tax=Alligator mississippiensis TaxID=8496 RepID=A0A151MY25_ALLMI|nr:hypothetical protein Y1Q_0022705 [Alligator mississippiensis]